MKKLVSFIFLCSLIFAQQIQPVTEILVPYQIKNGNRLSGISVDIVKEIQKRIGNHKKILVFPWNRAYMMTLKSNKFALFSTLRTEQRENLFKWVGPLLKVKVLMYKNKNNPKIYKTLEDAKKVKSIAVVKNDAIAQYLEKQGFKNLKVGYSEEAKSFTGFEKVAKGEVELYPMNEISANYRIKELGLKDKVVPTKIPPMIVKNLYIAFNKNTSDKVIQKWQKALDDIKKDGTYQKILDKYK